MGNAGNRVVMAVTLLGTTAECQVITAMTWFMETVKQDRHREREAGPQGGKGKRGRRTKLTLQVSP